VKKGDLPTRICARCDRQFAWRKKWARCWAEVRYCSDRCRREARRGPDPSPAGGCLDGRLAARARRA